MSSLSFMKEDTAPCRSLPFLNTGWGQFISYDKTLAMSFVSSHDNIPQRKTADAAGFDLCSGEDCIVSARASKIVSTGIQMQIAPGHFGKIEGRSGLGFKYQIMPFGGIIDSDYRGEIKVLLLNHSDTDYQVQRGTGIAQLIIHKYEIPTLFRVDQLSQTSRGLCGFGSTGSI
tara:strand:- start:1484 stop:2002 length:519 start_codon:yes stop_codon:yes gene_type:complete